LVTAVVRKYDVQSAEPDLVVNALANRILILKPKRMFIRPYQ